MTLAKIYISRIIIIIMIKIIIIIIIITLLLSIFWLFKVITIFNKIKYLKL